jgi:hypothetical protein
MAYGGALDCDLLKLVFVWLSTFDYNLWVTWRLVVGHTAICRATLFGAEGSQPLLLLCFFIISCMNFDVGQAGLIDDVLRDGGRVINKLIRRLVVFLVVYR